MNATATVSQIFTTHLQYSDWYFVSHSVRGHALARHGRALAVITKGREVYDEYYGYFIRCSDIFDPRHKPIIHAKMIDWLRATDSDETADWWARYWTGPWTLADYGYGNCARQNHQEGSWRPQALKRGTGCGAHGEKRQALGIFVCHLHDYIQLRNTSEKQEQQ